MTSTDQQLDLDAAEAAITAYQKHPDLGFACCSAHPAADAATALVAEVRRLRAELADQRAYEQRLREQHDLDVAALATARANALTAGADAIDDMERRNAWPVRPVDAGICSEFLRGMAAGSQAAEESHVVADDSDDPEHVDDCPGCDTDTLPAWLAQRFDPRSPGWDALSDDDRTYWEHHARAVRRAVARGGFKATPAARSAAV